MKTCFKCKANKPLSEFYKHNRMADGHLNKCKDCTKKDVAQDYIVNRDRVVAYEKTRTKDPVRRIKRMKYQADMRARYPERNSARRIALRALNSGKIVKQPCRIVGCKCESQMHHTDYSKPLLIDWLCREHHMIEEGKRPF